MESNDDEIKRLFGIYGDDYAISIDEDSRGTKYLFVQDKRERSTIKYGVNFEVNTIRNVTFQQEIYFGGKMKLYFITIPVIDTYSDLKGINIALFTYPNGQSELYVDDEDSKISFIDKRVIHNGDNMVATRLINAIDTIFPDREEVVVISDKYREKRGFLSRLFKRGY